MDRTAVVMLTWNKLSTFKTTLNTFKKYHPHILDKDFIVVDNGSTDGTVEFLKPTGFDLILNESNLGAQMGKYVGWSRAVERGYDFILFIEDDHTCYRTVPIVDIENYLDTNEDVGIVRVNDKPYLKRHQITRLPIVKYGKYKLNSDFKITTFNYHFTSHPSIFRSSLVGMLKGCVFPEHKPTNIDVESLGLDETHDNYQVAKERVVMDFGVLEKEYMRLYLLNYRITGQLNPPCFRWVNTSNKRMKQWKN